VGITRENSTEDEYLPEYAGGCMCTLRMQETLKEKDHTKEEKHKLFIIKVMVLR